MKKVTIIGKYNARAGIADGQAVKTRILSQEIEKQYGKHNTFKIDTYEWKKHPFSLLIKSMFAVRCSKNVIFMTDEGGIKVFPWLLSLSNIFGRCSLHYVVVGGWLTHYLKKHQFTQACLKKFDGIYVETSVMKQSLEKMGFSNTILLPNFKSLEPVAALQISEEALKPFRFCTFSRVMREKGIDDAVDAICKVNSHFGKTVCTLDIYGQIDPDQTVWFDSLTKSFPPEVSYCGVADYSCSTALLKEYFALLFPTEFFTEGVPGTIIDAYSAGVPVVASHWESFDDVIEHGKTGIGYPFGKQECLSEVLIALVENPETILGMKSNCLEKAHKYLPENVLDILYSNLN